MSAHENACNGHGREYNLFELLDEKQRGLFLIELFLTPGLIRDDYGILYETNSSVLSKPSPVVTVFTIPIGDLT
jgi:hypothetical protein